MKICIAVIKSARRLIMNIIEITIPLNKDDDFITSEKTLNMIIKYFI